MPEIGRIQSTNFQALLTQLGITRNNIPFGLQSEVLPVVLVGGTVSFVAAPTPAYNLQSLFSEGTFGAPGAGTLLAETAPLPAGAYSLEIELMADDEMLMTFQWIAEGGITILQQQPIQIPTNMAPIWLKTRRNVINPNELFRVRMSTGAPALSTVSVTIAAQI